MTNLKLTKVVSSKGEITWILNGNNNPDYELSRELTGTTGEIGEGLFTSGNENFKFGDFKAELCMLPVLDVELTAEQALENLVSNIEKVRDWVKACKSTAGSAEAAIYLFGGKQ